MGLRFAFDLGSRSLGWAIYTLENGQPCHLVNCGVRIFHDGRDPQSGESKAKDRREPRSMRRARDRKLQRRQFVMDELVKAGLMPKDRSARKALVGLNPYELRAKALSEALPLHHVGRAIFHLNQRRGFKSNRKTDQPDESGKIAKAAKSLDDQLQAYETLGAWYWSRQEHENVRKRQPTRIRMDADNKDELYEFYPMRHMLEHEFDLMCSRQSELNPNFPGEDTIARLRHALFYQRPLKPVKPGYCTFFPNEERLMKAHPLAEEFVLYQKVNQLRIEDDNGWPLEVTIQQRDKMIATLLDGKNLSWLQIRKIMGLSRQQGRINYEEGGDKNIPGSALTYRFKGGSSKTTQGPFKNEWDDFSLTQKETLLSAYKTANTDDELLAALAAFHLNDDQKNLVVTRSLPEGYLMISRKAVDIILPELKKDVITYAEACKRAGLHHSDLRDGELFDRLPYYNEVAALKRHLGYGTGDPKDPRDIRYGRIGNPTVHIGLNQMRRVINALMDRYGRPDEIVLELARDLKLSTQRKKDASRLRDDNRKANDKRREELEHSGFYQKGDRMRTREALRRLRLWEELGPPNDRCCPYSGKPLNAIALVMSDAVEIEHILPRSRTLDDSMANKTLAFREWNRLKRNLSPAEAADRYPDKFDYEAMIARTKNMPHNKRWRFFKDAMDRFKDKDEFADRFLKETQYLGVMAHKYLKKINPGNPEQEEMQVWVTTGRLTAELRRKWGLHLGSNYKNRDDHRHHAIDACVIGIIDRSLINRLAKAAGRDEEAGVERVLANIEPPYEGFTQDVNQRVQSIYISHRPDHRITGRLHEDAAYGQVRETEDNINRGEPDIGNAVIRRAVIDLKPKMVGQVRDLNIRQALQEVLYDAEQSAEGNQKDFEKIFPALLAQWSKESKTRRVRCLVPAADIVPIGQTPDGERYKYVKPGENHHMDIVETPDGVWRMVAVTIFEANQIKRLRDEAIQNARQQGLPPPPPPRQTWQDTYPDAKFIMRLHKGDTIQIFDDDGQNRVKRVVILHTKGNCVWLCGHTDGGNFAKRHADKDDPFRWDFANIAKLKDRRARRVRVDETGRIRTIPFETV